MTVAIYPPAQSMPPHRTSKILLSQWTDACDSLVTARILAKVEPALQLAVVRTCNNSSSGTLFFGACQEWRGFFSVAGSAREAAAGNCDPSPGRLRTYPSREGHGGGCWRGTFSELFETTIDELRFFPDQLHLGCFGALDCRNAILV